MDLTDLAATLRTFAEERDWQEFHTPKNLAVSVAIAAAELLELVQWRTDDEISLDVTTSPGRAAWADELADVLIYLVRLADVVNIRLEDAVTQKIAKNAGRFSRTE